MQDELLKLIERVGVAEQRYIVAATLYVLTRSIQTSTCFVTLQGEAFDIFHLYNLTSPQIRPSVHSKLNSMIPASGSA